MSTLQQLTQELQQAAQPERAAFALRYFKTGPGEYAEGDVFLGIPMPTLRAILKKYPLLAPEDTQQLLDSHWHEYRMAALLNWEQHFKRLSIRQRREVTEHYLANLHRINNWDLVDCSAPGILGFYLFDKDRSLLDDLAQTPHLWTQRVAIVSTLFFVRKKQYSDALRIVELLLSHPHDLIHKACGWVLREIGKKDTEVLLEFLNDNATHMPRTMLRYAIERLPQRERLYYLQLR